jgi:hypothetical protein
MQAELGSSDRTILGKFCLCERRGGVSNSGALGGARRLVTLPSCTLTLTLSTDVRAPASGPTCQARGLTQRRGVAVSAGGYLLRARVPLLTSGVSVS